MQKSFSIITFYLIVLSLAYSNSLNPLKSEAQFQDFNQNDFKDEKGEVNDNQIAINIKHENNKERVEIGPKGTLYFITDYNDKEKNIFNSSDIEEKTSFQTLLTEINDGGIYNITCRLWKPNNINLRLFCKLDESLRQYQPEIKIDNYTFEYEKKKISINFCFEQINIFDNINYDFFPFLYSDVQNINIDDEKDSYDLKFNIESYNSYNNIIYIGGKFLNTKILDDCEVKGKELICKVKKEDLIEILPINGGNLFLYCFWKSHDVTKQYKNVFNIIVNIKNLKKEDLYIGINTILEKNIPEGNFVPFETNVTNVPNLISEGSKCKLNENDYTCFLRKDPDKPLLFLCTGFTNGKYSLSKLINKEFKLDNIYAKYNFRIQPSKNTEEFEINNKGGTYVNFSYPRTFDYSKKRKGSYFSVTFLYKGSSNIHFNKLRFAPELEDLNCHFYENHFICQEIFSKYFENTREGYYNLYYLNSLNKYSILYEVPPIKVVLPNRKEINLEVKGTYNKDPIIFGEKGILYFVTNYNDSKNNIFDSSDIEKKTKFELLFDDFKISKIVSCRLWKPNNENLRILCDLSGIKNFYFNRKFRCEDSYFDYNEYVINIHFDFYSLFPVKKDYEIPFLYSDRQNIEIKNDIESYNLKFKIGIYNNELLYLEGEVNNTLILDNCQRNENELNCKITKEKLEEVLVKNNEQFKVGVLHDNIGLFKFNGVLDITINYKIDKKEDIYIGITESLTDESKAGVPFGFKTNVSNIPNIYTDIKDYCYFKKINDNPLLYLCRIDEYLWEPFTFGNITDEIVLNNLHYKYNFRIQPFEDIYNVQINGYGTNVKLILPEVLDFTSEDTLTIKLITSLPLYINNLRLNQSSRDPLECQDLYEMKKCKISISHFYRQKNGSFYLYYSDTSRYYDLSPIKVILPNTRVEIPIESKDNNEIICTGDKGLLYFKTNFNDKEKNIFDTSDIEEKTSFTTTIDSYGDIKCRLWKPSDNNLWVFCKLNDSLRNENIKIKDAVFHYKEYIIMIFFNYNIKVNIMKISVPLLYSDKQIINVKEEIESYELKFHIGTYNDQTLYLALDEMKNIILQDCKVDGKDLICNIKKEKFYEIFSKSGQKLKLYPCNYELKSKIEFNAVYDIIINFDNNIKKEDINIEITKLLSNNVKLNTFLAFETNITNIPDIISDSFQFDNFHKFNCRIKKSNQTSLLIICLMNEIGTFSLEEIKKEIKLDDINIKYNFRIQHSNIKDGCKVEENGNYIQFAYPLVLNYYLYDIINIDIYYNRNSNEVLNIILNPDLEKGLSCYDLENSIQRCSVPKEHFNEKKDGYYPIQYLNSENKNTTVYQLSPIQVIFPKDNDIIIRIKREDNKIKKKVGQKGVLYLITNFNDENNPFEDTLIYFNSTIKDQINNKYNVNCKLWKPKNDNLRIICKLNENLIYSNQKIILNKVEFTHNNYNITITQQEPFEVEQLNYDISFLYSDTQNIEIKEEAKSYNLKFNIEKYNDEILYMYGEKNNYIILDGCKRNENELNCKISKEKLEENLIKKNEKFIVGAINDSLGIIDFDYISYIYINYNIDIKEDIYVEITGLLSTYSYGDTPIAFKTNVTSIPNIITDKFDKCYFKKYKESSLLYLCNFDENEKSYRIDKEIIMNNIHYKYNFIILPTNETYYFTINNYKYRTSINLVYPEILNFTPDKESLTFRYITSNEALSDNLTFVSNSTNLECIEIRGLKKCTVSLLHFQRQKNGYFYLKQESVDESFIHYESPPINILLPDNISEIYVTNDGEKYNDNRLFIGKNGFFSFTTNYTDEKNIFNISDIEEETPFNTTIFQKNEFEEAYYKITCRLWMPNNDKLRLLCKLNEDIAKSNIKINSAIVSYKKYKILLISTMSFQYTIRIASNIPFLYSDKQEINIEENILYYELKFKIEEYNNDTSFLQRKNFEKEETYSTELTLEECNVIGKNLTCKIEKEKLIEYLHYNGQIFRLDYYYPPEIIKTLPCVSDITINYNISKKEDVYVGITKLLQSNLERESNIPYETNITSISNVNSDLFDYYTNIGEYSCMLKKTKYKPLLFLCRKRSRNKDYLGVNNSEVILNNIHVKYNFRIQPVNNSEEFTLKNSGGLMLLNHPNKLDFSKNNLNQIYFFVPEEANYRIKLNPDSEELICGDPLENENIKCLVPKSHFKESGYYYTYYLNDKNGLNIFYELSPIQVILPKEEKTEEPKKKNLAGIIAGSVCGGVVLIAIIVFFVVRHIKRKKAATENNFSEKKEIILSDSTNVE